MVYFKVVCDNVLTGQSPRGEGWFGGLFQLQGLHGGGKCNIGFVTGSLQHAPWKTTCTMVGANAILALSLVLCSMHLGRRLGPQRSRVDVSNKVMVAVLDLHLVEEKEEVHDPQEQEVPN